MRDFDNLYDLIIVGGGPAGLSAAIYAARAKEKVLVIEKNEFGGQIALTSKVLNYPGVKECSGRELAESMEEQARDFGAKLIYGQITHMELEYPVKLVATRKKEYRALSVILAPGAIPKSAGFEGEDRFKGRGVAYCATCDGPLFAGCDLFVVGGGLAAVEEAIFLASYSEHITLVVRENDFTCAKTVSDRLKYYPAIRVFFHTEIIKVSGEDMISSVTLKDNMSGHEWEVKTQDPPFGVFVFVGYEPNTAWLPEALNRDKAGYLLTDSALRTNLAGVSAAGDVRKKSLRQVVTATSDGASAAVALEDYIRDMHQKKNIPALRKDEGQMMFQTNQKAILKLWLDESKLSKEMEDFLQEKEELKDCVTVEVHKEGREDILLPSMEICRPDGSSSGIHFHAVPMGLEWNSFQMALFNVIGPGQKIDAALADRIRKIDHKMNLKVLATLTCGNCPTSVMSACQIASLSEHVTAEIFDIMHFRKLRFKYQVMSVPTLIINDEGRISGKMNVPEMLDALKL